MVFFYAGGEAGMTTKLDLRLADKSGADLTAHDLRGVDMYGAKLDGCKLDGCDLTGANLSGVSLVGASLKGTILPPAWLCGADYSGLDLSQAIVEGINYDKPPPDPGVDPTPIDPATPVAEPTEPAPSAAADPDRLR